MHKIILLGGGGFIGNALARVLMQGGHDVLVLNRTGRCAVPGARAQGVNRAEPVQVLVAAKRFGADILIDMIAFEQPDTRALLEMLGGHTRRYVLVSSCDVYAAFGRLLGTETGTVDNTPLDEGAPLRKHLYPFRGLMKGRHDYDKIPLEQMALQQDRLEVVILRLPMVFGPGDPWRRYQGLAETLLAGKRTIAMEEKFARWKSPHVYVDDVGRAIALAVCHRDTAGQVFNIGPDEHLGEAERARAFARAIGQQIQIKTISGKSEKAGTNYNQHIVLNSDHLRHLTGWHPRLSDQEAFQRVWADITRAQH